LDNELDNNSKARKKVINVGAETSPRMVWNGAEEVGGSCERLTVRKMVRVNDK
jgi:hypothetical protein